MRPFDDNHHLTTGCPWLRGDLEHHRNDRLSNMVVYEAHDLATYCLCFNMVISNILGASKSTLSVALKIPLLRSIVHVSTITFGVPGMAKCPVRLFLTVCSRQFIHLEYPRSNDASAVTVSDNHCISRYSPCFRGNLGHHGSYINSSSLSNQMTSFRRCQ